MELLISSLYVYHLSTVVDFSSKKYSASTGHRGTPGTSREIYSREFTVYFSTGTKSSSVSSRTIVLLGEKSTTVEKR